MSRPKIERNEYSVGFLRKDPLAGIDLEQEYELIMQKKSTLSAKSRRRVIAQIEYNKKREEK